MPGGFHLTQYTFPSFPLFNKMHDKTEYKKGKDERIKSNSEYGYSQLNGCHELD